MGRDELKTEESSSQWGKHLVKKNPTTKKKQKQSMIVVRLAIGYPKESKSKA